MKQKSKTTPILARLVMYTVSLAGAIILAPLVFTGMIMLFVGYIILTIVLGEPASI